MRVEGLEPTHLAALDPKSSVSTNSTTPASALLDRRRALNKGGQKYFIFNVEQGSETFLSIKKPYEVAQGFLNSGLFGLFTHKAGVFTSHSKHRKYANSY